MSKNFYTVEEATFEIGNLNSFTITYFKESDTKCSDFRASVGDFLNFLKESGDVVDFDSLHVAVDSSFMVYDGPTPIGEDSNIHDVDIDHFLQSMVTVPMVQAYVNKWHESIVKRNRATILDNGDLLVDGVHLEADHLQDLALQSQAAQLRSSTDTLRELFTSPQFRKG